MVAFSRKKMYQKGIDVLMRSTQKTANKAEKENPRRRRRHAV